MMRKRSSLSLALLLCLLAPVFLSLPAYAGVGCGTNWMGDTTGDTDFYVSKNQNQGTSGSTAADGSATGKSAVALGSASRSANASIEKLTPDRAGPQDAGATVIWTAVASNSGNEKMYYDFLLSGPSTGGRLADRTGWIEGNSWAWNTSGEDAGESLIVVRVKRAGSTGYEDSREESYIINAGPSSSQSSTATPANDLDVTPSASAATTVPAAASAAASVSGASGPAEASTSSSGATDTAFSGIEAHPASKTSEPIANKPRTAPDERKAAVAETSGPNMDMPDPTPKAEASAGNVTQSAEARPVEEAAAVQESEYMDVEGKWTVKLDSPGETLDLSLFQADSSVMGSGNLNEKSGKLAVTAKGSVSGNSLSLEVWTVVSEFGNKVDKSVDLELVKVDRIISGSYDMYSGEDLLKSGNATASRLSS